LPRGKKVAAFELADRRVFEIAFLDKETPRAAAAVEKLVDEGFYDGTAVRAAGRAAVRIGDDAKARRLLAGVPVMNEADKRWCVRGAVVMARTPRPRPGGRGTVSPSEFLILREDSPGLDADYCVFAGVVGDLAVVDSLEQGDVIIRARLLTVGE
jgi:cyclophilin family peptidyl-prolyl cis-trans isomerase